MNALRLIPVGPADASRAPAALRTPAVLALGADGRLVVGSAGGHATPLGELRPAGGDTWFLLPASDDLLLDGIRPLPLAVAEPGSLLAAGAETWFLTAEWSPEPQDAPPELADRQCPVCGGELRLARVVRCVCGRYAHLEDLAAPNDPNLLNCHLAGPCGVCQRPPSLDPVLVPEPPAQLVEDAAEVAP